VHVARPARSILDLPSSILTALQPSSLPPASCHAVGDKIFEMTPELLRSLGIEDSK
jgi:hypothetical protein